MLRKKVWKSHLTFVRFRKRGNRAVMNKHENKVLHFLTALQDCYKDAEEKASTDLEKLELSNAEISDDFYAIIQAFFIFYKKITGDTDMDILGFSHLLNRLVFQYAVVDESEGEADE